MSNAASRTAPPKQRGLPLDWMALLVPVLLAGVLFAFVLASPTTLGLTPREARPGGPGIGDPYFPDDGNAGYDVTSYVVNGDWNPDSRVLSADATLVARAKDDLKSFYLDLYLDVDRVTVDGEEAGVDRADRLNVEITPETKIRAGRTFTVVVSYSGDPGQSGQGEPAWYDSGGEWTVAGEPGSAPWWFPSNDHPSDPATFELNLRVPAGTEVISIGRLVDRDTGTEADFDTWHWQLTQPAATYLVFMSIGQFAIEESQVDGRQAVYAVSEKFPPTDRTVLFERLRSTAAVIKRLEADYGRYPFTEIGGVAPAAEFWFAGLETQTRPVYQARALLSPFSAELLTHELAHQWFGDQVTLAGWKDIFINEAYASYAWWRDAETLGQGSAQKQFDTTFANTQDQPGFWRITMSDPGADDLFSTVYVRGPMALQALRNVMGDQPFFAASRAWAQQPGSRSLEQWRTHMQAATDQNLDGFFAAWLDGTVVPARSAENGFG